ncbi:MAG: hypothetical protein ACXW1P_02630 [Methylophilaceae bacterium]
MMKRIFILLTTLLATTVFTVQAHAEVGVSVSVGQPGFYGQIDIGDFAPQPRVIYAQPVIIQPVPVYQRAEPIYLHVPPGHAKRWSSYCGRYNACGRPVYFVQDTWYRDDYAPRYREYREREGRDNYRHDDSHDYRGDRHDDRGGKGHGNGKSKGHGKD